MSESLEIHISPTPNPHAMKVTLNRVVTAQGKTYRDAAGADTPWAKALLSIPGVVGVYAVNNFISVNKRPDIAWDAIVPQAEAALRQAFG